MKIVCGSLTLNLGTTYEKRRKTFFHTNHDKTICQHNVQLGRKEENNEANKKK